MQNEDSIRYDVASERKRVRVTGELLKVKIRTMAMVYVLFDLPDNPSDSVR